MADQSTSTLLKHRIKKDQPSSILSDYQLSNLAEHMLPMYRRQEWILLYRMSEHGTSMITFDNKVSKDVMTMVIIQDEKGHKFGSL